MSSKVSTPLAHSDTAFFKQTELAREALKTFNAISVLNAPGPTRIAMEELVNATVRSHSPILVLYPFRTSQVAFNPFVPQFLSHPAFQEIPPKVYNTLEGFFKKHPNFDVPGSYNQLGGLNSRIRDSIRFATKKGKCLIFI